MYSTRIPREKSALIFILITDISNFYRSIYTHSIAWALHGKPLIRSGSNRYNYSLIGNRIDRAFFAAMDEQTNGLPVGNAASHLAAEIILKDVDDLLSERLAKLDFIGFRFRDDYRFLVRTYDAAKKIEQELDQILQKNYGISLNMSKTKIVDDIIANAYRPWKSIVKNSAILSSIDSLKDTSDLDNCIEQHSLERIFLTIYEAQKQTEQKLAPALLEKISDKLNVEYLKKFRDKIYVWESILEAIVDNQEQATPQFATIIGCIVEVIERPSDRLKFLKHVVRPERISFMDEQQIAWLYRMLLPENAESLVDSEHPMISILISNEYPTDYSMFNGYKGVGSSTIHKNFKLIDRTRLESLRNKKIEEKERSPFYPMFV